MGSEVENPVIRFIAREKISGFSAFCSCPGPKREERRAKIKN
jgi:hypothetical protein